MLRALVSVRAASVLVLALATGAWAHDVSVELGGTLTTTSANNPRAGAFSLGASGAYDLNERWSVLGGLLYTRDLATRTPESFSPGSNIFLLNLGAMWLPTDSLMTTLSLTGSPPAQQSNATTVTGLQGRAVDLVVASTTWSLGAQWNGLWSVGRLLEPRAHRRRGRGRQPLRRLSAAAGAQHPRRAAARVAVRGG